MNTWCIEHGGFRDPEDHTCCRWKPGTSCVFRNWDRLHPVTWEWPSHLFG